MKQLSIFPLRLYLYSDSVWLCCQTNEMEFVDGKRENERLTRFIARVCLRWRVYVSGVQESIKLKSKAVSSSLKQGLELNDYARSYMFFVFLFPYLSAPLWRSISFFFVHGCFVCSMSCAIEKKRKQNDQSMGNYRARVRWSSDADKRDNSLYTNDLIHLAWW